MVYLLLLVGFVLLLKGADFFVEGSSSVAKLMKIPPVVIGLTIVAMGTSAPEAAVSITAGLAGSNEIALSNVIGSNIFNLLMVLGICAIIQVMHVDTIILKRDMPWNIGCGAVVFLMMLDGVIGRLEGVLLLILLAVYLIVVVRSALKNREEAEEEIKTLSIPVSILAIIGGLAAIIIGGDLVVDSAKSIALAWGMSETLVGLTIVAIGTSLPELATSVVAARKGESGLAFGNAVGSCLFNLLFILGMSTSISAISFAGSEYMMNLVDIGMVIVVSLILFIFAKTGKKITKAEGIICVLIYVGYMAFAIIR